MKKRNVRFIAVLLPLLAVLLIGCQTKELPPRANYDVSITAESLKPAFLLHEKGLDALDSRLETYNQTFHESLEPGLMLPVLQLIRDGNTITLRPSGLLLSLCVDEYGETAQCVFTGSLKGDIQAGYGGDWKRYGLEVRWAENVGAKPFAYVDIGVSIFIPVLLVQEKQDVRMLWYTTPDVLYYSKDGSKVDYQTGVSEDTPWRLESLEMLMEGYERYFGMCRLYPNNYMGLQWISVEEYQEGLSK